MVGAPREELEKDTFFFLVFFSNLCLTDGFVVMLTALVGVR